MGDFVGTAVGDFVGTVVGSAKTRVKQSNAIPIKRLCFIAYYRHLRESLYMLSTSKAFLQEYMKQATDIHHKDMGGKEYMTLLKQLAAEMSNDNFRIVLKNRELTLSKGVMTRSKQKTLDKHQVLEHVFSHMLLPFLK
jgi:hypothetical protein